MALQHLRSSTANKRPVPGNMSEGQLALNSDNGSPGLFFKDSNSNLVKVGPVHVGTTAPNASPAVGGTAGNSVGEQWLDTTGGTYVFKVWDGSAWRSESGTFVDVNGDVMTGALGIIAGSASAPGLYVSGDTNTGIYSPGADQLAVSTGGSERLRITSAGLVGIGTSAPSQLLDISTGAVQVKTGASVSDATYDWLRGYSGNSDFGVKITTIQGSSSTRHGLGIWTSNAASPVERVRITDAGLVGVGTSSPGQALDVKGSVRSSIGTGTGVGGAGYALYQFGTSATATENWHIGAEGDGSFRFYNQGIGAGIERLRITAAGSVGIGTTSPGANLHVRAGNSDTVADLLRLEQLNAAGSDSARLVVRADATANEVIYDSTGTNNGAHVFKRGGIESARIDSSGRLLVGASSAVTTVISAGLQVQSSGANAYASIGRWDNNVASPGLVLNKSRGSSVGTRVVVQSGDILGEVSFMGDDGTSFITAAQILSVVDGTPGANDMPGRLVLSTTSDGASSPTERLRVTQDGYVRLLTSSPGIQFNGDTAAANALDDYEEGTFTPTIVGTSTAGTATYGTNGQQGRYTKIGNRVFFDLYLAWSAHTGTGDLQINGLPFTVQNTTNLNRTYSVILSSLALTAGSIGAAFSSPNTTTIALRQLPTGGGAVATIPMDTSAQISISGSFDV